MNEKWFALSLSEIEKKLKTNAASGLSRKAARSRWKAENGSIFFVNVRSPFSYVGDLASDFAFVMLALMSLLALCFGENETGTVATVVILLNLAVSFVGYYRSEFFCDSLERFFLPRSRVIRDGKLYSVDGNGIVRGDVIMLSQGDVIPCDARLVTSDMLKVQMLVEKNKYILLDKAAERRIGENENDPLRYDNIVHAGSVVVSGSGRAIVIETGRYTYVGAKIGRINVVSKTRNKAPRLLTLTKKFFSKLSLILLAVILPFSVICMLFGNTTLSLFTAFTTAIAVAASSLARFATSFCKLFYTLPMRKCVSAINPSLIRSCDAMDRLSSARYLFILDGAALSDGVLHFSAISTLEGEYDLKSVRSQKISESAKRLGELAVLYDGAHKALLSTASKSFDRYDQGVAEFIAAVGADSGAMKIRCQISGFSAATESADDTHDRLFFSELGERYMLTVSFTDSIINECYDAVSANGGAEYLSDNAKQELMSRFRKYESNGKRVLVFTLCRHDGAGVTSEKRFIGMLTLAEIPDPTASRALAAIEAGGTKPLYFRNIEVDGKRIKENVSMIPVSFGADSVASVSDFVRNSLPLTYGLGKISSYNNFSDVKICELIDAVHARKEQVAVLGFCEKYKKIFDKADVIISCSSDEFVLRGGLEEEIELIGAPDDLSKKDVPQILKQRADVIIPRPQKSNGGGCASLLSAFIRSRIANVNAAGFFRYVICMQTVRMVLVMVPMLFGSAALDARHVLLGGFLADLLVMFSYATDTQRRGMPSATYSLLKEFSSPIRNNTYSIGIFSASALFAAILPEIVSLFPAVPKYIDSTEYSLVVFVLFHIVVFACMRFNVRYANLKNLQKMIKQKPEALSIIYPVVTVLTAILCFTVPQMALLFDIEGFTSLVYLLIAFIPPIIGGVGFFLYG